MHDGLGFEPAMKFAFVERCRGAEHLRETIGGGHIKMIGPMTPQRVLGRRGH